MPSSFISNNLFSISEIISFSTLVLAAVAAATSAAVSSLFLLAAEMARAFSSSAFDASKKLRKSLTI